MDPRKAAEYHCDKHVVKMILETAQLLYCAHWILNPDSIPPNAYKKTHINHPCSIWVRESYENYAWTAALGWWLCLEYTHRYGKTHKTQAHIEWLLSHPPTGLKAYGITPIKLAMPIEYKREDPIESYRLFYKESKLKQRNIVTYKKRAIPDFLI